MKMNKKAFTLIEMAIVITIIGIVVGTFINLGTATLEKQKISTTKDELKAIKSSLIAYAARHGRLPYPDTDGDGKENDGNGNIIADCTSDNCELPYLDLRVKSKDNFGIKFQYDAWDDLLSTNRDNICHAMQNYYTGDSLPSVLNDVEDTNYSVIAVIFSKGKDKVLTGENIDLDREYEMSENSYNEISNDDLVMELTIYDILGSMCNLVPEVDTSIGLVAHYKLTNNLDDEEDRYDATGSGSITYPDGTYINTGANGAVNTSIDGVKYENWSVSIWLRRTNWLVNQNTFIDVADPDVTGGNFEFFINGNELRYRNNNINTVYNYSSDATFTASSWHHYIVTQERKAIDSVDVKVYVDGNLKATNSQDYEDLENLISLGTGRWAWGEDIDEFRFYDYALSTDQVTTLNGLGR